MSSRNDEIRRQLGFGLRAPCRAMSEMVAAARQCLPAVQPAQQSVKCDDADAALLHGVQLAPFSGNHYFSGTNDSEEN